MAALSSGDIVSSSVSGTRYTVEEEVEVEDGVRAHLASSKERCAKCGTRNADDDFCAECGALLEEGKFIVWRVEDPLAKLLAGESWVSVASSSPALPRIYDVILGDDEDYVITEFVSENPTRACATSSTNSFSIREIKALADAIWALYKAGVAVGEFDAEDIGRDALGGVRLWKVSRWRFMAPGEGDKEEQLCLQSLGTLLRSRLSDREHGLDKNVPQQLEKLTELSAEIEGGNLTSIDQFVCEIELLARDRFQPEACGELPVGQGADEVNGGLQLAFSARSHPGMIRANEKNEDGFLAFAIATSFGPGGSAGVFAVADGMGGEVAGEIANSAALKAVAVAAGRFLSELRRETTGKNMTLETVTPFLKETLIMANQAVLADIAGAGKQMGCTLVLALIIGRQLYLANVGDCRAYVLGSEGLRQLTVDHSAVYRLYKSGQIQRNDIYTHPDRNVVLRCIGEPDLIERLDEMRNAASHPYCFAAELSRGDRVLLCSDGLWEMVKDDELAQILGAAVSAVEACHALVAAANANGGEDNVTALAILTQ